MANALVREAIETFRGPGDLFGPFDSPHDVLGVARWLTNPVTTDLRAVADLLPRIPDAIWPLFVGTVEREITRAHAAAFREGNKLERRRLAQLQIALDDAHASRFPSPELWH